MCWAGCLDTLPRDFIGIVTGDFRRSKPRVVQVNRSAPLSNRLLLEFSSRMSAGFSPMRDLAQYQPISGTDDSRAN